MMGDFALAAFGTPEEIRVCFARRSRWSARRSVRWLLLGEVGLSDSANAEPYAHSAQVGEAELEIVAQDLVCREGCTRDSGGRSARALRLPDDRGEPPRLDRVLSALVGPASPVAYVDVCLPWFEAGHVPRSGPSDGETMGERVLCQERRTRGPAGLSSPASQGAGRARARGERRPLSPLKRSADDVLRPDSRTPPHARFATPGRSSAFDDSAHRFVERRDLVGGFRFVCHRAAPGAASKGGQGSFGTAAPKAALWSRERFERLPGRLIPNDDHMELDNRPVPCRCGKHRYRRGVPRGYTHRLDEACPFLGDDFVRGHFGECCWLRGKVTSYELLRIRNGTSLAGRMHLDMTAEEALVFAEELRRFADEWDELYKPGIAKPRDCKWNEVTIDASGKFRLVEVPSYTFRGQLATIRNTADWYEKTSQLGFGVRAWS